MEENCKARIGESCFHIAVKGHRIPDSRRGPCVPCPYPTRVAQSLTGIQFTRLQLLMASSGGATFLNAMLRTASFILEPIKKNFHCKCLSWLWHH